jgi:hypothetical protein
MTSTSHELTPDDPPEPFHVTRFGAQIDVQGLGRHARS